jgi:hypothetical protein
MNYTYRIEHIKLFDAYSFIERDDHRDLLAVRENQLHNFMELFYLSEQERQSYYRIVKWVNDNHTEFLL